MERKSKETSPKSAEENTTQNERNQGEDVEEGDETQEDVTKCQKSGENREKTVEEAHRSIIGAEPEGGYGAGKKRLARASSL